MRLIDTETFELHEFYDTNIPHYAILSHRWDEGEVSHQEFLRGDMIDSPGQAKIRKFCSIALATKYQSYAWVDTCCIDKTSSAELSEAINSMFQWYTDASLCIVYLSDVTSVDGLTKSRWFTRGWTLQELLAPNNVLFYDKHWQPLGSRNTLCREISAVTGIPVSLLDDAYIHRQYRMLNASVSQKMTWAAGRQTSRIEDRAYCLMGLFGVNMPLLYGEGNKAFKRLQQEILASTKDESIFAWTCDASQPPFLNLLAESPEFYKNFGITESLNVKSDTGGSALYYRAPVQVSANIVQMEVHLLQLGGRYPYGIPLNCKKTASDSKLHLPMILPLKRVSDDLLDRHYRRAGPPFEVDEKGWEVLMERHAAKGYKSLYNVPMQQIFIEIQPYIRIFPRLREAPRMGGTT